MEQRPLGRSGLQVSAIGLGLAALGRPGYLNLGHGQDLGPDRSVEGLRTRTRALLDIAYDEGIRYFDAARSYGKAEEFLAGWLFAREGAGITVGSKWGYTYTADWQVDADPPEVKDLSVSNFERQLEESRALLGGHLVLYQIHSATPESLADPELRNSLERLRLEGVRIGLTTSGASQAATIDRALEVGGFDAVQATWNLHEPSAGPALLRAHDAGLGVILKETLANGLLTERAASPRLWDAAAEAETTPDAIALAGALAQPFSDVVLSGATTARQLQSNLRALEVDFGRCAERLGGLVQDPDDYWERRAALAWT